MTALPTLRAPSPTTTHQPQLSWDDDLGPSPQATGEAGLRQRSAASHNLEHGRGLLTQPMAAPQQQVSDSQIAWIADPPTPTAAAPLYAPQGTMPASVELSAYHRVASSLPACPVPLAADEQLLRYHKPTFLSFPPTLIGLGVGALLALLLTIGAGEGGFVGGLVLVGVIALLVRTKLWRDAGCWVTSERLVLHDGTLTRLVPYAEIDAGSITFEGDSLALRTRGGHPLVLKGVPDAALVADLLSRRQRLPAATPPPPGGLP